MSQPSYKELDYRPINGYPGYIINADGQVVNIKTGRYLRKTKTDYEYYQLVLANKRVNVAVRKLVRLAGFVK